MARSEKLSTARISTESKIIYSRCPDGSPRSGTDCCTTLLLDDVHPLLKSAPDMVSQTERVIWTHFN